MNIQKINYLQAKPISFGDTERETRNEENKVINRNDSYLFRIDLDWASFVDKLKEKYKDQDKVNVYCYACSDGSEPYSLAMMLISELGYEGAQKFFPIKARDIDDYYFDRLKRGKIAVNQNALAQVKYNIKDYSNFLHPTSEFVSDGINTRDIALINPILKNTVIFEKGDLREDIHDLPKSNTVLMFRSAMPYLKPVERNELIKTIAQKLDPSSLFVLGCYDEKCNPEIQKYLLNHNFKMADVNYCFEKKAKKETQHISNDIDYLNYINQKLYQYS